MKTLIIDATDKKILLGLIINKIIYTGTYTNSKKNYDRLIILITKFLLRYKTNINSINKIYVNRGPGSYSGIRNSLSIVKGIYFSKKIDFYSYSHLDFKNKKDKKNLFDNINNNDYLRNLPYLCDKFNVRKNLIKPLYLS